MKKLISIILAFILMFALASCGNESNAKYTIGICEFTTHSATSEVIRGFCDYLSQQLGDDVAFDVQNAGNDFGQAMTIINNFVSRDVDLILADNTQSLQIASTATNEIPILGAAITDYTSALDASPDGTNISGTSDLAPLDLQAAMIIELFPEAETIGLIYCSSEANSLYQINIVNDYLLSQNLKTKKFAFDDANDLSMTLTSACEYSDVIYLPTDNTLASCTGIIDPLCREAGVPVVTGEKGMCAACGVATLSIDYYQLGKKAGDMAYKVLVEGADVTNMPIQYEDCVKMYNAEICADLGITVPSDYIAIE